MVVMKEPFSGKGRLDVIFNILGFSRVRNKRTLYRNVKILRKKGCHVRLCKSKKSFSILLDFNRKELLRKT
jgi:hypothetical protein